MCLHLHGAYKAGTAPIFRLYSFWCVLALLVHDANEREALTNQGVCAVKRRDVMADLAAEQRPGDGLQALLHSCQAQKTGAGVHHACHALWQIMAH